MRADRLLSILLLLQTHRRLTAGTLAGLLDVSERTIQRDMEALSMAGIPVYADRGVGGGWSLIEGFATRLTELTPTEIETLFLVKPAHLLLDLGMAKAANTALDKLLALLPVSYRREAEVMRQRIHIDLINLPYPSEQTAFLPLLQSAIRQERQVQMTYQMSNGAMLEARVAPLGLVARGSLWYLVASHEKQGNRAMGVYRVTRIQAAQITASLVNRPKNFDLAACWEELFAALMRERNQYQVTAHIHCSLLPRVRCSGRLATSGQDRAPPTSTEWRAVVLCFDTAEEACEYLLAFGPKAEVIAPIALREMVYTRALALAIRYAPTASSPNAVLR
jgi:predicted DNA-binding transcriptional regulator YafY